MSGEKFKGVDTAYKKIWKRCPYTNFVIFSWPLEYVKVGSEPLKNWTTFLGMNMRTLTLAGLRPQSVPFPTDNEKKLWDCKSGLCTPFSIRVSHERALVPANFAYGNSGGHRANWSIYGVKAALVDSSARQAIEFKDITTKVPFTKRISGKTLSWYFDGEILKFKNESIVKDFTSLGKGKWMEAL